MIADEWVIPSLFGLLFSCWLLKKQAKDLFVFSTFAKPKISRYVPGALAQATRFLMEEPEVYLQKHPTKFVQALETITNGDDRSMQQRAAKTIVDNIKAVAAHDEDAAAQALLTVINRSESGSLTQHRALTARPGIINSLAASNPMQAVLLAQKGIACGDLDEMAEELSMQSCELALQHLDSAFYVEPVIAAHAACNIARKTSGDLRDQALWMLLSHVGMISEADFESGHAATEQAALLGTIGTPLHKAALGMWEWHIGQIMANSPAELINKTFYGFGISTAKSLNKCDLYEHGFDFLRKHPAVIKEYAEKVVNVSLGIGLKMSEGTPVYQKTVDTWTGALRELCNQNLHKAIQAANQAMTFTAPGSQFERQAKMACSYLKRLEDDVAGRAQPVFEETYAQ